jgi:hypothetical protein
MKLQRSIMRTTELIISSQMADDALIMAAKLEAEGQSELAAQMLGVAMVWEATTNHMKSGGDIVERTAIKNR